MPRPKRIIFINRKPCEFFSIERVFQQVSASLQGPSFETSTVNLPFGSGIVGILLNLFFFRVPDADVLHVTGQSHFIALKLPHLKTVLTIHDLRFLRQRNPIRRFLIRKLFLEWPVRRAAVVTAVSDLTREEIIRETGCAAEKVVVASNPIRTEFLHAVHTGSESEQKVVLHIGTMANKNLENLVLALQGTELLLHVVGRLDEAQRAFLKGSGIASINSTELDADGILKAYIEADVLSFCSTFEGFGLPVIEAQAVGLPVVTSDVRPMRDIAGGAAILVDPSAPESIRKGIQTALADVDTRERLVAEGRRNVLRFLPDAVAESYRAIYDNVGIGGQTGD